MMLLQAGVETEFHGTIDAFAVILATGGLSYPRTGSTGDGYRMAKEVGHTVTEIVPSLVPMTSDDPSCSREAAARLAAPQTDAETKERRFIRFPNQWLAILIRKA